jgi:phosphonate transport system substrate-binding protein
MLPRVRRLLCAEGSARPSRSPRSTSTALVQLASLLRLAHRLRWALVLILAGGAVRAEEPPLELGLAPYISVRPLMTLFQPLADFLEQQLGRPVLLVTAPSLREFDERVLAGGYEVAMLAPQAARLAQKEAGYVPLLRVSDDLYGVFLVAETSPVGSMKELTRTSIAFPDPFTATAHLGRETVAVLGIGPDQIVYPPGYQDSLPMSLRRGEYQAALMNGSAFFQIKPEEREGVRVLGETRRIPHVMFLARPDLPPARQAAIRAAIEAFMASPSGAQFTRASGLTGVRPPSEAEMRKLDSLAREHKRLLEEWGKTRSGSR